MCCLYRLIFIKNLQADKTDSALPQFGITECIIHYIYVFVRLPTFLQAIYYPELGCTTLHTKKSAISPRIGATL